MPGYLTVLRPSAATVLHWAEYRPIHYDDVIMGAIASLITSLTIVNSTVYSDADQRKHQSSASLAFVRGIQRGPVNSPHKWPVTRKMFPFDDVIMLNEISPATDGLTHWVRDKMAAIFQTTFSNAISWMKIYIEGTSPQTSSSANLTNEPFAVATQKIPVACQRLYRMESDYIVQGWGLLEPHSSISPLGKFSILQKHMLKSLNHIHIWQMSPPLSCGDICQIWTWHSICSQYFDNFEKLGI